MIVKHLVYTFIYIDLLSINFNLLAILQDYTYHQISDFEIYTSLTTIHTAKYIVLSNIISVASDNILRICIQEPFLISKKIIVLLHTLSAYNSLLVRYKVYSSDLRECLCTSCRYAESYENFSVDSAPCRKNPMKNKIVMLNCQPLLLGENSTEIKA